MAVGSAVGLVCLAACGTDAPGTATDTATESASAPTSQAPSAPATSEATSTPSTAPPTAEPPFPRTTADQYQDQAGARGLVLTDVEVAAHDGFDRVVLEFSGTGVPGWSAGYVDQPRTEGSGERVTLEGDAFLGAAASGTTWPADDYYDGPERLAPEGGGPVSEVYVGGTFEGYTHVIIGIAGDAVPYRVFPLADPARLVVDVAGAGTG